MTAIWFWGVVLVAASVPAISAQETLNSSSSTSFPPTQTATANPAAPVTNRPAVVSSVSRTVPAPVARIAAKDTPLPPGSYVSSWLVEVLKLAQARVDDCLLLTFIDGAGTFNLGADQIIYLRDLGLSNEVITAMIQHDFELLVGIRQMSSSTVSASPPVLQFVPAPRHDAWGKREGGLLPGLSSAPASVPLIPATNQSQGIVNTVGSPELELTTSDSPDAQESWSPSEQRQAASEWEERFPVRAPHAVQLTEPIVMLRAFGRTPNVVLLELFP